MKNEVQIDGAMGEGGGQIVRSSLALSMLTGRPVTIHNVRARRDRPGLQQQHLTAVLAAKEVCGAKIEGASIGSRHLEFQPGPIQPGEYTFRIGTAGSATLVIQTVLPALLVADKPSRLVLEGGTHNPWSPPFDFLQKVYLPLIHRMGPTVTATLERHGFYPAGGGRVVIEIIPAPQLGGFDLLDRGAIMAQSIRSLVANLPLTIAEREVTTALSLLNWGPQVQSEHVTELFVSFGRKGVRAERVAEEVASETLAYLAAEVPIGVHLADQLVLPLAISAWQTGGNNRQRGGAFRTMPLTGHTITHIEIIERFLDVTIALDHAPDVASATIRIGASEIGPP
jgi:RNA 3'-terminal phosphate cyclase (ATP)